MNLLLTCVRIIEDSEIIKKSLLKFATSHMIYSSHFSEGLYLLTFENSKLKESKNNLYYYKCLVNKITVIFEENI